MKIKFNGKVFVSLIIVSLLVLPAFIQAEGQKIRVVAEDTNVRIKPDLRSDIIASPAVGTVFDVEKKIGEWYEIVFSSSAGISITAYVHEIYVEIVIEEEMPLPNFFVSLGGMYSSVQAGYNYTYKFSDYGSPATIYDSIENGSAVGFNIGFGFFVLPNIEITASADLCSTSLSGKYGYDLQDWYFPYDIAYTEVLTDAKFTKIIINFGANFHLITTGMIRPYVGGGISYIMGKIDLLDIFSRTWGWDIDTFWTHMYDVSTTIESLNKLGFNVKAGINFAVSRNIFIFSEGRYIIAKKTVVHHFTNENIDIDLGGVSIIVGAKIGF